MATPSCVAAVCIVVAGFDRLCMCSLGHDALFKIIIECRDGMKEGPGGLAGKFTKLFAG